MKKNINISISVLAIICLILLLRIDLFSQYISKFFVILRPIIIGVFLAFLINPLLNKIESIFKEKNKYTRIFSVFSAFAIVIASLIALLYLVIPELNNSILKLLSNYHIYIDKVKDIYGENNFIASQLYFNILKLIKDQLSNLQFKEITLFISGQIPFLFDSLGHFLKIIVDILVAIIVAIYLLLDSSFFLKLIKNIISVIFKPTTQNYIYHIFHQADNIFKSFIIGKIIDSIIIGIICFVAMSLLNIEYAILISVIVAITNVIPVFGPFIGAVPGILLLSVISFRSTIIFIVLIIIIQQFDGNILGPMILGEKVGLPPLGILISVIVGGGLFSYLGMFLGVPIFALIYNLFNEYVDKKKLLEENLN